MMNNKEINIRPDFSAHFKENIAKKFSNEENNNSLSQEIFSISKSFKNSITNLLNIATVTAVFMFFCGVIGIVYLTLNYSSIGIILLIFRLFFFSMFLLSGISLYGFAKKVKDVIIANTQDAMNFQLKQFFDLNSRFLLMLSLSSLGLFLFILSSLIL